MRKPIIIAVSIILLAVVISSVVIYDYNQARRTHRMIYQPTIPTSDEKVVCIVFDDGWKSQLKAIRVLDTFGYKATLGIIVQYVQGSYPAYLSWDEIRSLQSKGYDIASHSLNHKNLNNLTESELEEEIVDSAEILTSHVTKPYIFTYPFGQGSDNTTVVNKISQQYLTARKTALFNALLEFDFNITKVARYDIPAVTILNTTTLEQFSKVVGTTGGEFVLVLVYHEDRKSVV
jgi:peptidoglycan/xylan/chitin deacetylase (PgdA/CDA1 family)